jgi:hypothetical protein
MHPELLNNADHLDYVFCSTMMSPRKSLISCGTGSKTSRVYATCCRLQHPMKRFLALLGFTKSSRRK